MPSLSLFLSLFRQKEISVCIELAINGAYDQIEYSVSVELHHLNDMLLLLIVFSFTLFRLSSNKKRDTEM